jgi:leucyl aminopeptidase
MPITRIKQSSLDLHSPICFTGNVLPPELSSLITTDLQNSLTKEFEESQKYRVVTDGKILLFQGAALSENADQDEQYRQMGVNFWQEASRRKIRILQMIGEGSEKMALGCALKNYRFEAYKREPSSYSIDEISLDKGGDVIDELNGLIESVSFARDLVNEPANVLTAEELANRIEKAGKQAGYSVEVFRKAKIKSLKMGGLLSVNQGSTKEPTFTIIEHRPSNAVNTSPVVLVGKGIVYDTGGLSLKPTANSMDIMKCDMGGAAAVAGAIHACALNQVPLHIIGLIPATDNQPGPDAYAPGDVITMHSGLRVEVMNTDAEGRLVMADALSYAKQYNPQLVLDLATLTGSSMRAIGNYAGATMGTADDGTKRTLLNAGFESFERLVEFPLWDDYDQDLESDIADTKNLGSTPMADVIIAGKFLQKFTDYPWMHIDIAGPAFLPSGRGYLPKGATGFGVQLLYHFFKKLST